MIAWIALKTGMSALAVKLILSALAIGAILYGLRLWGNRQWYKGEMAGRQNVAAQIEKQKQAEWKIKEAAIIVDAVTVATEKRAVEAATEQLEKDRATIARSLKDSLAAIQQERRRNYENIVVSVPDPMLWDAIRSISRDLAAPKP